MIKNFNQFLNESFHDFDADDIITDKYLDEFVDDNTGEDILDYYIEDNSLDPNDSDTISKTKDFRQYLYDTLAENLEKAQVEIYDRIENGKLKIYRAIAVDDNWLEHLKTQGKRLGIYWSWNPDGAIEHWGFSDTKKTAIIESEIEERYVDWKTTLELNMHPLF